jgi:hypothetical protein
MSNIHKKYLAIIILFVSGCASNQQLEPFVHLSSGLVFPPSNDIFELDHITYFSENKDDVGVFYRWHPLKTIVPVTIVAFVYPKDRYPKEGTNLESERDRVLEGYEQTILDDESSQLNNCIAGNSLAIISDNRAASFQCKVFRLFAGSERLVQHQDIIFEIQDYYINFTIDADDAGLSRIDQSIQNFLAYVLEYNKPFESGAARGTP